MCEREGYISVWGGCFDSEAELFGYVEKQYCDDGSVRSGFLDDFPVGWYDEDFAEASVLDLSRLRESILAHSYGTSFIDALLPDILNGDKINSIYIVYDFYAMHTAKGRNRMQFVGVYPYKK